MSQRWTRLSFKLVSGISDTYDKVIELSDLLSFLIAVFLFKELFEEYKTKICHPCGILFRFRSEGVHHEVRALCEFEVVFALLESCTSLVGRLLVTIRDNLSVTSSTARGDLGRDHPVVFKVQINL
jgi:hypothetical protein